MNTYGSIHHSIAGFPCPQEQHPCSTLAPPAPALVSEPTALPGRRTHTHQKLCHPCKEKENNKFNTYLQSFRTPITPDFSSNYQERRIVWWEGDGIGFCDFKWVPSPCFQNKTGIFQSLFFFKTYISFFYLQCSTEQTCTKQYIVRVPGLQDNL